ncbi:MAG TPA: peptidylprolyl isomerase [Candidatus Limnocylindria bacterium]|nr:peptidylprolyl isomerase [Candidatus Limnocylindria bacterium]
MSRQRRTAEPLALVIGLLLAGCAEATPAPRPPCPDEPPTRVGAQAELEGVEAARVEVRSDSGRVDGSFTLQLFAEEAPLASANFVALARCGFYDGVTFHRVLAGFVAQAGDPQTRTDHGDFQGLGSGGPGYRFEIEPPAEGLGYEAYSAAMANAGQPNTNGSQFFICLADLDGQLEREYTIFARVTDGTDVVDAIAQVPVNGPQGVPLDPVVITSITVSSAAEARAGG